MKKNLLITTFVLILIILFILIYLIFIKNNQFKIEDVSIIIQKDNYDIRISYPEFNNKKFNNKIKEIVDKEQKDFINIINKTLKNDDINNFKYELIINYNYLTNNDIYSIHFKILKFVGGDDYERNDMIFYYDRRNNEEVFINDLVSNENLFYEEVRNECNQYLLDNKEQLKIYKEEDLITEIERPEFISFGEDSIQVIFPSYSDEYLNSSEISIPIKYDLIKRYLNTKYFFNKNSLDDKSLNDNGTDNVQALVRDEDFYKDKKLVALTFDDGPSWDKTEKLLDGLKERNAKVSFFMLGSRIKGQEALVKRIFEEGHTIGSHSYEHKNFHNIDLLEAMEDINKTNQLLKDITGVLPKYLRPPYGNYSNELLDNVDMAFILWSVDSLDWKRKNSDKVAQYIIDTVKDGDIVLLHDLYDTSIEGAFKAIDELSKEGYVFVSIDELISIKGKEAEIHKAYRYIR